MKLKSKVLIIAGSDSSGGAGIQADIKTVTALGSYATTAVTAVTAQNTKGVKKIIPIPTEIVQKQISIFTENSVIPSLYLNKIKQIKILKPLLPEQKQISSILSNIDTQIQKEKLHKSNLERLKKGLMQKLLTGQIRVKVR